MAKARKGRFVWYEHMTRDADAAIAFYADVAGWRTQPFGDGGYRVWVGSQGPLGGVMPIDREMANAGLRPMWMGHVQVDDLDAALARVPQLGGQVKRGATPIPEVGRFASIADPQGVPLLLFQPGGDMDLHDPAKDGEICWNELMTTDAGAAFRFHSELFGWQVVEDMDMGPMGTYRIYGVDRSREGALGGMMTIPKGAPLPPAWLFYISTSDLDAAIGRATRKGGKVVNGPMDVPGGGRIAQLVDPQGAAFALHQAPKG